MCSTTTTSTFNTPLEMPERFQELYVVRWKGFQYSIGDALKREAEDALSYQDLSILHWRCLQFRGGSSTRLLSALPFNTPLEMRDRRRQSREAEGDLLSILHWRCRKRVLRAVNAEVDTFNSPLEMLGVLVFGFCGFLSFVSACVGFLT